MRLPEKQPGVILIHHKTSEEQISKMLPQPNTNVSFDKQKKKGKWYSIMWEYLEYTRVKIAEFLPTITINS